MPILKIGSGAVGRIKAENIENSSDSTLAETYLPYASRILEFAS